MKKNQGRAEGIDGIRKKKKTTNPLLRAPKKKKFPFFLIVFLIVVVFVLGFCSFKFLEGKFRVLKIFKDGKYLIIFQNNSELRPTGGFIGSFATVNLENYKLRDINFNTNIYKLDKAFVSNHTISPPEPLKEMCDGKWALRDSNWAVSFPEAAEQIEWFYEEESNDKVDGVIAINASVLKDILEITGPIEMSEYNTTISAQNFFNELTTKIEKDYFLDKQNKITNEPKTILKDLMPKVFEKLGSLSKIKLGKLILREIKEKQILLYADRQEIEKALVLEDLAGQVKETKGDYLYINHANISSNSDDKYVGGKSSLSVDEEVNDKITSIDGELTVDLTIIRTHNGSYIWPDGINKNWTRILVPLGAKLSSAAINDEDILNQVEIGEEAGKSYFGFYNQVAPKTSTIINLKYSLPKIEKYSLLVQKQSGILSSKLLVTFEGRVLFNGKLTEDLLLK